MSSDECLDELLPSCERSTGKLLLLPVLLIGVDLGLAGDEVDLVEGDDLGLVIELVEDPDGEECNYTHAAKIGSEHVPVRRSGELTSWS